ncbi:cell division protein SepF [Naasia lichenicola]|uniref:Cell division protein SepF n=1 Tax=Naasia lichenicola TaxID=2565933 RepID=A0A4S4FUZ5_9MICO|nr:cell division protein SepF [Naasia lichenicola]THG33456.1 cell division protein SepF [Naasia lichenicola]
MSNPIKKTMVYLGLADDEYYDDEPDIPAAPAAPQAVAPLQQRATVTALPKRTSRSAPPAEMNEILTVHPRQYRDAQSIAESFRDGIPVIINLSQMSEADARRLIDFASGLSQGLFGKIERVTNKVFLLSPAHINISGDTNPADPDLD